MKLRELRSSWAIAARFRSDLARDKRALSVIGGLALLVAACHVLRPWPIQWIVDGALVPDSVQPRSWAFYVWSGATVYLLVTLAQAGLEYLTSVKTAEVGNSLVRNLRHRVFEHLSRLSPSYHARNKTGDILVRLMGDMNLLRAMLVDASIELGTRSLWVLGTIAVMLYTDASLTLVLLATLPPVVLVVRVLARSIRVAVSKQRRKESVLADFLHESIAATETIQSLGRSQAVVRRFARSNRRSERAGLKAARLTARLSASVQSMLGLGLAVTLVLGSYRVASGDLMLGELLVFLSYVRGLLKPVRSASRNSAKIAKGAACGERILEILDEEVVVRSREDAQPAPARPNALVFEEVWFRYGDDRDALAGFDASFRRGELVGVFGRSGAGKSTLAALAVRLHDPERGSVRIDDVDLRALDLQSLRDSFGLCMQSSVLFGDSIRENLLLGRPDATDAELIEACHAAGAGPFLRELPDGLDTVLGASGAGLSGGQRRRLALARTLLRQAPILIVDEPFAGLDHESVEHVRASLREYARERIVIVIAHELDHLDSYDRVVFVERGVAVDSGSHARLLERCPAYRATLRLVPEAVS